MHSLTSMQKTASGIFLPSSVTSTPLPEATVVAVGPGAPNKEGTLIPTTVKAGDRVLLPGWGGNSIKVGEEVSNRCFATSDACAHRIAPGVLPVQGLGNSREDSGINARQHRAVGFYGYVGLGTKVYYHSHYTVC